MVSRLERKNGATSKWELVERGEAVFHQFGCNFEQFETGAGNFSTAIIEWPDGRVENVEVEHVRFLDAHGFSDMPTQHNNKDAYEHKRLHFFRPSWS